MSTVKSEPTTKSKAAPKKDHVDRFLEHFDGIPGLDYDVEGIVERIQSLSKRLRADLDRTLADHGLSLGEWRVLGSLRHGENGFCSTPGELAAELELSSGAMTNRLDRLEKAGFIKRGPDPSDRRGVKLELTKAGDKVWLDAAQTQARKEALIGAALTKREQAQTNALLRKMMLAFDIEGC